MRQIPVVIGFLAAGVALAVGAAPTGARAAPIACGLDALAGAYQQAKAAHAAKNFAAAAGQWGLLADAGFGPAQRRMAELHLGGRGVPRDNRRALAWALLAARAGDLGGVRLAAKIKQRVDTQTIRDADARVAGWRPAPIACDGASIKVGGGASADEYEVELAPGIPAELKSMLTRKLPEVVAQAKKLDPMGGLLFPTIDGFEFVSSDRYDRYVGWKVDTRANVLRMAASNFYDHESRFLARAIVLELARKAYGRLSDSTFADSLMRRYKNKRIVGAVYPDVKSEQFFRVVEQAFVMAEKLPPKLRRYVDIVDEIRYNPPSKHFLRFGTIDATAAYYNKRLSAEGNRIIFVRRNVIYVSALFLLRSFVHEGTHAVQDQQAERNLKAIPLARKQLRVLENSGRGQSAEAVALSKQTAGKLDYATRWYRGKQTERGRIQDIAFECEATINEILTVQSIGGNPSLMSNSGYLKLCPEAKRLMVAWQDQRFRDRNLPRK